MVVKLDLLKGDQLAWKNLLPSELTVFGAAFLPVTSQDELDITKEYFELRTVI